MGFARVLAVGCAEGDLVFQLLSTQDVMGWNLFHEVSFARRVKEYGCLEMIFCYWGCDWAMTVLSQQEGGWVSSLLVRVSGGPCFRERERERACTLQDSWCGLWRHQTGIGDLWGWGILLEFAESDPLLIVLAEFTLLSPLVVIPTPSYPQPYPLSPICPNSRNHPDILFSF